MKISDFLEKYDLSESSLDSLVVCMMEGKGLQEAADSIGYKMSIEKLFAAAKWYCEVEFGSPIDEIAPQMALDRIAIQEPKQDEILKQAERNKELKRLKAIEEDLMLYKYELRQKSA